MKISVKISIVFLRIFHLKSLTFIRVSSVDKVSKVIVDKSVIRRLHVSYIIHSVNVQSNFPRKCSRRVRLVNENNNTDGPLNNLTGANVSRGAGKKDNRLRE